MIRAANMVCCAIKVNPPSAVRRAQSTKIPHLPLLECTFMAQKIKCQWPKWPKWPKWTNDLSRSDLWVYYVASKTQKTKILLNVALDWHIQPFIFLGVNPFASYPHCGHMAGWKIPELSGSSIATFDDRNGTSDGSS